MADWYFRSNKPNSLVVCPGCRNLVRRGEEFCPFCAKRLRAESSLRAFFDQVFSRPDTMTRILIGMIVAVFFLQLVADHFLPPEYRSGGGGGFAGLLGSNGLTYIRMGSNSHVLVALFHEYWRWVTYCFLHGGLLHILFNCWAFWDLGRLVEKMWGWRQVFAVFILTGITGGGASYAWNVYVMGTPSNSVGASGAICGILGMLLGAYYRNKYAVGEALGALLIRWAVTILVFGLVVGADNAAHIGGMIGGAVLGYLFEPVHITKRYSLDKKIWTALALLSLALLVASIGFAVAFYAQGPNFFQSLFRR